MAQYKLGTISITNGTNIVTGASTQFLANVAVGNSFKVSGVNALYNVIAVDSDTQIRISPNYAGTTVAGSQYQISKDFTPNLGLAEIETGDSEFAFHLTHEVIRKLDAAIPDYTDALAGKSPLAGPGAAQAFSVGALSAAGVTIAATSPKLSLNAFSDAAKGLVFVSDNDGGIIHSKAAFPMLRFGHSTNGGTTIVEDMRLTNTGNLLINTPTDNGSGAKLQVNGSINAGDVNNGSFIAGTTPTYQGKFTYAAAGDTALYIDQTYDSASASIMFRMRTSSTNINTPLCIKGTGTVLVNTTTENGSGAVLQVAGAGTFSGAAVSTPLASAVTIDTAGGIGRIMCSEAGGTWNATLSVVPYGGNLLVGEWECYFRGQR